MPTRSATTTEQDLVSIETRVPKTIGAPLHHLDLVGDALSKRVGHGIVEVVEDLVAPVSERPPGVEELIPRSPFLT